MPRLLDLTWERDWALWSRSFGLDLTGAASVARFSLFSVALEEAKASAGVLMGHECLVQGALDRGELVRPIDHACHTGMALVFEIAPGAETRHDIAELLSLFVEGRTPARDAARR